MGSLQVAVILFANKGASVHAWLGRALCRGSRRQMQWGDDSCPTARRRLLFHVHRLPTFHLPIEAHVLAVHLLGRCSAVKVCSQCSSQPVDANILSGLCWTGLMFRSGFLGESPSSLAADLLLLVTRFDEKDNKRFRFFPEASKRSGLSVWVGQELGVLGGLPDWAMVVIVCILVLQLKRKILQ